MHLRWMLVLGQCISIVLLLTIRWCELKNCKGWVKGNTWFRDNLVSTTGGKTSKSKATRTVYRDWGGAPETGKPGIWLFMWGTACCACCGTDVSGLFVWIYGIGIPCDDETGWPGWICLGANCCICWEYCNCWPWIAGIPTLDEGTACPACPNCCEVMGTNVGPCCAWMTGRNCR